MTKETSCPYCGHKYHPTGNDEYLRERGYHIFCPNCKKPFKSAWIASDYVTFEGLLLDLFACMGLDEIEVLEAFEDDNDLFFKIRGPRSQLEKFEHGELKERVNIIPKDEVKKNECGKR